MPIVPEPLPPIYPSVSFTVPPWLAADGAQAINKAAKRIQNWLLRGTAPSITVTVGTILTITLTKGAPSTQV